MSARKLASGLAAAYARGNARGEVGFAKWLDTFLSEKGIDGDEMIEVEGPVYGLNLMPTSVVTGAMKLAPKHEQRAIKALFVKIDFANGDVRKCIAHLGKAVAL